MKSFLLKNTKNDKVNNWGVELASKYTLNFEYVKGVKNTLADTMSRLVTLDPDITLVKEPEGYQFGKQVGFNDNVTEAEVKLVSLAPVASAPKNWESHGSYPRQRHVTLGNWPRRNNTEAKGRQILPKH